MRHGQHPKFRGQEHLDPVRHSCDLARRGIHNGEVIADILCHVDELSVGRYGDARGIAGACAVRSLCLRQHELVLERRCTVLPRIDEQHVGVAARDVEVLPVGREGGAVERAILQQGLRDPSGLEIDDLNALFPPPAEHDDDFVARSDNEIDRQTAQLDGIADRIESQACGKRRCEAWFVLSVGGDQERK